MGHPQDFWYFGVAPATNMPPTVNRHRTSSGGGAHQQALWYFGKSATAPPPPTYSFWWQGAGAPLGSGVM